MFVARISTKEGNVFSLFGNSQGEGIAMSITVLPGGQPCDWFCPGAGGEGVGGRVPLH